AQALEPGNERAAAGAVDVAQPAQVEHDAGPPRPEQLRAPGQDLPFRFQRELALDRQLGDGAVLMLDEGDHRCSVWWRDTSARGPIADGGGWPGRPRADRGRASGACRARGKRRPGWR